MEHYVTIFDSLFLPQGLALHASLQRVGDPYTLWVLCVDDAAHDTLRRLALPHVRLLALLDVELPALSAVKASRTRAEYCWTLTPFAPLFVLQAAPEAARVTYLDADLWFTGSVRPVFAEFERSGKSVLITEHSYAPEYDQTPIAGRYCVQFMTFVRGTSEPVRSWWADRCIEWCHARLDQGRFGDQMYLNDWTQRFGDLVHVLEQRQLLQAPWNATRFAPSESRVFHFHGLRLMKGGHVLLTPNYRVPGPTLAMVYQPYLDDLRAAIAQLAQLGTEARPQTSVSPTAVRLSGWRQDLALMLQGLRMRRSVKL